MKKLLYIILFLLLYRNYVYAYNVDITEQLQNTKQKNEILLEQFIYNDSKNNIKISNSITDTQIIKNNELNKPEYLLKDELTTEFKNGPISKIQVFGAYRGGIDYKWNTDNYSTTYDNLTPEIGFIGTFKDSNWGFKSSYFPLQTKGEYMRNFFSDTYIVNKSIPHHQIYAGYSRVNVGHEGGQSPYILPFVNRSQMARNFGNTRSLNVKVVGDYQYMDYNVSFGSSSHSFIGGFPGTEFNAWVDTKPFGNKAEKLGKLVIGGGFNTGYYHDNYTVFSGYAGYERNKFWTSLEAGIANGYNGSTGYSNKYATSYVYSIGYKITPKLEILGRVDQFNSDKTEREYTTGINYYIKGQSLKFTLNYVFCQAEHNSHKIITALQILL